MGFYEQLRDAEAGPLIKKYGLAATLRRIVPGVYNPATRSTSAPTTTDYPCNLLVEEYSNQVIDGTYIKQGDKKFLIAAQGLAVVPQINDHFILPDGTWIIPDSKNPVVPLAPGGIAVIYTVQVRQ